jgi:hypothetical protein
MALIPPHASAATSFGTTSGGIVSTTRICFWLDLAASALLWAKFFTETDPHSIAWSGRHTCRKKACR